MQRLLALLVGALLATAAGRAGTVLIIPFFNLSGSNNLDWISESISQSLGEALASRGLLVVSREDRLEVYRRLSIRPNARLTRASVIKAAQELDAGQMVFGEFEVTPEPAARRSLRIAAALLDIQNMKKGPEFVEQGRLEDLARLQNRLAWHVLRHLAPGATPSAEQFLAEHPPVRLDALENYNRGLLAPTPEQKLRYYAQAVRLEPEYSQPCFELGRLHWERKEHRLAAGWLARVKPTDPHYWEANFLLGLSRYYTADYAGAAAAFELVARSVPLNEVFNNLAAAQSRSNWPEALENFEKALEGDPADPDYQFNAGYVLWKRKEFAAAAERFRAALERNPDDAKATLLLGRCLQKSGPRPGEAAASGLERLKHNFEECAWRALKARFEVKTH